MVARGRLSDDVPVMISIVLVGTFFIFNKATILESVSDLRAAPGTAVLRQAPPVPPDVCHLAAAAKINDDLRVSLRGVNDPADRFLLMWKAVAKGFPRGRLMMQGADEKHMKKGVDFLEEPLFETWTHMYLEPIVLKAKPLAKAIEDRPEATLVYALLGPGDEKYSRIMQLQCHTTAFEKGALDWHASQSAVEGNCSAEAKKAKRMLDDAGKGHIVDVDVRSLMVDFLLGAHEWPLEEVLIFVINEDYDLHILKGQLLENEELCPLVFAWPDVLYTEEERANIRSTLGKRGYVVQTHGPTSFAHRFPAMLE